MLPLGITHLYDFHVGIKTLLSLKYGNNDLICMILLWEEDFKDWHLICTRKSLHCFSSSFQIRTLPNRITINWFQYQLKEWESLHRKSPWFSKSNQDIWQSSAFPDSFSSVSLLINIIHFPKLPKYFWKSVFIRNIWI